MGVGSESAIAFRRQVDVGVPEPARHGRNVDVRLEAAHCEDVAQIVPAHGVSYRLFQHPPRRGPRALLGGLEAQVPATLQGTRDRALLALGLAGAFRRSELAGLNVADLKFTDQGLEVVVRRSKTDQEGAGLKKAVPFGSHQETCPVLAVRGWLQAAGITAGPVFRRVTRQGTVGAGRLDGGSVARVIKRVIASTGRRSATYSGHSLRAGLITAAVKAGKTEASIMRHTGHRSIGVLRRYVRLADLFGDNCVAGIGL